MSKGNPSNFVNSINKLTNNYLDKILYSELKDDLFKSQDSEIEIDDVND